jgi:hypothetical protein
LPLSQFEQHKAQQSGQAKHGNEEAGFDIAAHKKAFFLLAEGSLVKSAQGFLSARLLPS